MTHDQAEAMTIGDRICVMRDGRIQQVAPPMEVYDKPVNRFVAGFLGTPPMNFFNGKIAINDTDTVFILGDETAIKLSDSNGTLLPYSGQEMVLGVRPEHLTLKQLSGQSGNCISSTVNVIEPLGDKKDVYLTASDGQKFIANLNPHVDIAIGQQIEMFVDTKNTHIFELGDIGKSVGL